MPDNLRSTLYEVADRAGRPLPDPLKLQRLTEALAELYDGLRMALRAGTADALDVVNRKVRQAQENSKRELLGFLERDELLAFLDATHGLERLPNAAYWARADGTPTLTAEQIFDKGTTQSVTHPPEIGIVKVVTADFRKIAIGFFSPARLGDMAAQASEEIAARWGWIGLHRVVEVLKQAKGDAAWHEIETALRLKELHARCIADGVTKEFEPHWLDFLVRDFVARSEAPETRGVLWFDREKAWRKAGRPPDRAAVPIPDRAEEIFVRIKRCAELWPDCSWAEFAGLANSISETSPTDKPGGDRFPTRRLELRRRGPVPTGDKIKTAAKRLLEAGKVPGQTITWKVFHTEICQELNVEHGQRGYSQDTVEVAVRPLLASKDWYRGKYRELNFRYFRYFRYFRFFSSFIAETYLVRCANAACIAKRYHMSDPLLSDRDVERITGRARSTLQKDRVSGSGIPFIKLGRLVRYRQADVTAFLDALPSWHSTSEVWCKAR